MPYLRLQKIDLLLRFMDANKDLLTQSKNLQMLYCWTLFDEGKLLEARAEFTKLNINRDDPNYRLLEI